jgi:RNA polymerase sigma-70 factor, ECF subfamily
MGWRPSFDGGAPHSGSASVPRGTTPDEIRRRKRSEKYQSEAQPRTTAQASGPDLGAEIRDCLERLPEPRRVSVTLHLQGFRLAEVATTLRWSEKRVENLIYRGMADLRRCLRGKEARDRR